MTDEPLQRETGRVEAFSDGVFSIAITLLILDLKVPDFGATGDPGPAKLLTELRALWPNAVAYLMSFAVILVMWVNHHRIFTVVQRTDQAFLFWNGLLLLVVSIVPFPTALLAKYFLTESAKVVAAVYAGHGLIIALAFTALWRHATRNERLLAPGCATEVAKLTDQYRYGPLMYVLAFLLAFVSAWASIGLCLLFALFFSFQGFTQRG